jgi:2-oxoglutarate ferredoxin oxidoreductase subunit alpha
MSAEKKRQGRMRVLQGNEACVEGALAAGCRFFTGYPITPANEIAEGMARRLPLLDGVFLQVEDEIAAITSLVGAAWGGAKAMTATSGPGFCLMQEGIGLAVATETPCVIVNVQRGGPASGQSTSPSQGDVFQARYGSNGDYALVALAPANAQEMFDFTVSAFNHAERFRVPVIVLSDEVVAHIREKVFLPDPGEIEIVNRKRPTVPPEEFLPFRADADGVPPMPSFNEGYDLLVISQVKGERGDRARGKDSENYIHRLTEKVERYIDEIADIRGYWLVDARYALVSYGSVSRSARSAVEMARERGLPWGGIELKTLWPFHAGRFRQLAQGLERVVVAEMNMGRMIMEVERAMRSSTCKVELFSKVGGAYPTPAEILEFIL